MATVPPTKSKLIIRRGGRQTTTLVPRPVVVIDTREQAPYTFDDYSNWIGGVEVRALKTADYSIAGYESVIAVERKTLQDIVGSLMHGRERFLRELDRLASFRSKCLCIEATRTELKSPYQFAEAVKAHPNGVVGSLDALMAKFGIPIHYGDNRQLSEEFVASWLSKAYTYQWLEENGHGRFLQEDDL
jgi:ERCC4-type nuclease